MQLIVSRMFLLQFLGLLTFLSVTSGLTVMLGHTATIPCNRRCSDFEWFRKDSLVCSFTEGKLNVAPEFEGRIEFSQANLSQGTISLTISSVVYNDRSWYLCSCDGDKSCDHYLEVLVPTSVTVMVGDKAKLPCYAETDKLTAESKAYVEWKQDDRLVAKLEHGETESGAGFKDRVSVSKQDYNKGDLSLTIDDVRSPDTGLYRCFVQNGKSKYPEVVELTVTDSPLHWTHYISVLLIAAGLAGAGVLLWIYRQKLFKGLCCSNAQHHPVAVADGR
ncbi:matrix remodeling-associated protein 8-like [Clarias gariepinus]|uniref:matrix remodeling-associated protein 8 n=1 Tax=Clarias gariepinus TaxID=13013 RepID=UPI00234E003B|nr:matrix remodeling-associated protein 8 [Clarias gariepinus]